MILNLFLGHGSFENLMKTVDSKLKIKWKYKCIIKMLLFHEVIEPPFPKGQPRNFRELGALFCTSIYIFCYIAVFL